jgi:pimeloyl-ACP methyl ester carboxylesterase
MQEQFQHNYAEVNKIKLHYVSAGQGEPVMLVHGFPEFWYAWKKQLSTLSSDYHLVAPDMRGYNLSDKPTDVDQYHIDFLVNDLLGLADQLGWQKFTLVAHDWGGLVAWWLAIKHPERLKRLVIINIPHPATIHRELATNPLQQKASAYIPRLQHPQAELGITASNYAGLINSLITPGLKEGFITEADKELYLEAWTQPGALTGMANYYRRYRFNFPGVEPDPTLDMSQEATTVKVPTLVIWGENDQAILIENLNGLEDYVPDLIIKRIPEGTHWVVHKFPDLVNQYLKEFIPTSS